MKGIFNGVPSVAGINQGEVKNKTSQQKDGGRLSSSEYLIQIKNGKNVLVRKSKFLSTHRPKSDGKIIEMLRA